MPTYNKIVLDGTTLIDLSNDTVDSSSDIVSGLVGHLNNGSSATGTAVIPSGSISITSNGTVDVTNYASAIVNVSGGGGGLEYETGTYTPTADIAHPSISFTGSHLNRPFFVGIVDAGASIASTDSVLYWFIFSLVDFSNSVQTSSSSYRYARTQYSYKTSSSESVSGNNVSALTGTTNTCMPFYLTNTEFKPYAGNTSRYFRSTRSYKWIAVWA